MSRNLIIAAFGAISLFVILAFTNGEQAASVQRKESVASANQKDSLERTLSERADQIKELKEHVQVLETEQAKLRTQPQAEALPADLSELSRFDCEADFNRAHAMALAQRTPGYTLEGAAALNCTQRLAKVTEKAMRSLERR